MFWITAWKKNGSENRKDWKQQTHFHQSDEHIHQVKLSSKKHNCIGHLSKTLVPFSAANVWGASWRIQLTQNRVHKLDPKQRNGCPSTVHMEGKPFKFTMMGLKNTTLWVLDSGATNNQKQSQMAMAGHGKHKIWSEFANVLFARPSSCKKGTSFWAATRWQDW